MKTHWKWFLGMLILELGVATGTPWTVLSDHEVLRNFVRYVGRIAPTVENFAHLGPESETIQFYLAVTILLLPLKILFGYLWLNSDASFRKTLVISPLTIVRPHYSEWALESKPDELDKLKDRSMFNRVTLSFVSLVFCAGTYWYVFFSYGSELAEGKTATLRSVRFKYDMILDGGISMWAAWSVTAIAASLVLAIAVCIVRDYLVFLRESFSERGNNDS